MSAVSSPPSSANNSGPSLFKLVSAVPEQQRLSVPADALIIIGRQIEALIQDRAIAADVAIGTLRFSLFRMHQGRIAQLAASCRSVTVYGEADIEPPEVPGVEFVALAPDTALCQEWFLVVDSPDFWGALLTRTMPDRRNGNLRRYLFEGTLTTDERIVSRTRLLLSLLQRRSASDLGGRDRFANRASWAQVAYALSTHSEAERLALANSLGEFPELLEILGRRAAPLEQLLSHALETLHRHSATAGAILYHYQNQRLYPLASIGPCQPSPLDPQANIAGQALQQNTLILTPLMPNQPERAMLPEALSAVSVPLHVQGQPWGVLLAGQHEADPHATANPVTIAGVAALLEKLLADSLPSTPAGALRAPEPIGAIGSQPAALPLQARSAEPALPAPPVAAGRADTPAASDLPAQAAPPLAPSMFGRPAWMRGANIAEPPLRGVTPAPPPSAKPLEVWQDRSWATFQKRLMGALVAFDQRSADYIWNEACGIYPTEAVCTELLIPVQVAIGEGWHRGEVSVAAEHFSSRFVQGKLLNLLNAQVDSTPGPLAVIGCAQNELHELGAVILSLFMRWSGFRVIYLGQNVPNSAIAETIRQLRPQVLGLSASTPESARTLIEAGKIIVGIEPPRPLFIYGGMAFYERADLRGRIQGLFLEGDIRQIVRQLAEQLRK